MVGGLIIVVRLKVILEEAGIVVVKNLPKKYVFEL